MKRSFGRWILGALAVLAGGMGVAAAQEAARGGAIVGAKLVKPDAPDNASAVVPNTTILIRGNRIEEVGPDGKVKVPKGATRIDARGKWVIPGLIDGHVHFFQSGNLYTRPDGADF